MRSMVEGASAVKQASRPTPLPPPFGAVAPPPLSRGGMKLSERNAPPNGFFAPAT